MLIIIILVLHSILGSSFPYQSMVMPTEVQKLKTEDPKKESGTRKIRDFIGVAVKGFCCDNNSWDFIDEFLNPTFVTSLFSVTLG